MGLSYNPFDQKIGKAIDEAVRTSTALKGPKAFKGVGPYANTEEWKLAQEEEAKAAKLTEASTSKPTDTSTSALPSKSIWNEDSTSALSEPEAATTPEPTSGTPFRSGNILTNFAGGIGSQIPSTVASIAGFGGDLVGAINPYSEATFKGLLDGPQTGFAKEVNKYGNIAKEELQRINQIDPESGATKAGEAVTDLAGSLLGPNKVGLLKNAGMLGKAANIGLQGTLDAGKFSVASEGRLPTWLEMGVGVGARGVGEVIGASKKVTDALAPAYKESVDASRLAKDFVATGMAGLKETENAILQSNPTLFAKFFGKSKPEQAKEIFDDVKAVADKVDELEKSKNAAYKKALDTEGSLISKENSGAVKEIKIKNNKSTSEADKRVIAEVNTEIGKIKSGFTIRDMDEVIKSVQSLHRNGSTFAQKKIEGSIKQLKDIIRSDPKGGQLYKDAEELFKGFKDDESLLPTSFLKIIKDRNLDPQIISAAVGDLQTYLGNSISKGRALSGLSQGGKNFEGLKDLVDKLELYKAAEEAPGLKRSIVKGFIKSGLQEKAIKLGENASDFVSYPGEKVKEGLKYIPGVGYVRKKIKQGLDKLEQIGVPEGALKYSPTENGALYKASQLPIRD